MSIKMKIQMKMTKKLSIEIVGSSIGFVLEKFLIFQFICYHIDSYIINI